MRRLLSFVVLAFAIVLTGTNVNAQESYTLDAATTASLDAALSSGNAQAVMLVVASKSGDPAAMQALAATILAAAQSLKGTDPAGSGILAAIAIASGGLQGNAAVQATGLVNTSGSAIAATIIAFANSGVPPAVIANAVLLGITINPVQIAQSGVNSPSNGGNANGTSSTTLPNQNQNQQNNQSPN